MSGHGAHGGVPPEKQWAAFWISFIIYLLIGLACAMLAERMMMAEGAKRALTRIWGPLLTSSYPSTGRDQITVMLVDDEDLRDYDETWPVSLGFYQRRLQDMVAYKPKAVFFDIVFLDDLCARHCWK